MNTRNLDLAAPSVEGVLDGELDPNSVPEAGANVHVLEVSTDWADETLTVYLRDDADTVLFFIERLLGPHGRPVTVQIPKDILVDNTGKDVTVSYSVTNVGDSHPMSFTLAEGFSGVVEFDLSPHNYLVAYTNSQARPPEELPAFTRMQRVLPGATGYGSSDETIARVDHLGIVTALSNGAVSITASGAPSGPSSYQLTIKGIDELHVLSSAADWSGADRLCRDTGLTLPSVADFARLKVFYPLPIGFYLNLPDYPVWGTVIGAGTANTYDLNSGAAEGMDITSLLQVVGVLHG
ncbi:hypothetical protein [Pseudomonas japonica]|uniref:Ig-like domain (Group 2) n=1 Tax=Pseudomonas japonica TaxID=256466 RepID=A0A239AB28_9PSED|nr:hypothetical protein [Pseudomonas japonica]SNR92800.1 hypothetical protein SAMN05444352_101332 [Pseudomonas japonica]